MSDARRFRVGTNYARRAAGLALAPILWVSSVELKAQRPPGVAVVPSTANTVPLGFSSQTFTQQRRWEKRFLRIPSPARCEKYLRRLTREPHIAGTPGDRRISEFIFDEFKRAGLNPEIVEYRGLVSH